jgi:hypothetical protein
VFSAGLGGSCGPNVAPLRAALERLSRQGHSADGRGARAAESACDFAEGETVGEHVVVDQDRFAFYSRRIGDLQRASNVALGDPPTLRPPGPDESRRRLSLDDDARLLGVERPAALGFPGSNFYDFAGVVETPSALADERGAGNDAVEAMKTSASSSRKPTKTRPKMMRQPVLASYL